eukprot:1306340-Lingulodinium_polyedra.AAC.1
MRGGRAGNDVSKTPVFAVGSWCGLVAVVRGALPRLVGCRSQGCQEGLFRCGQILQPRQVLFRAVAGGVGFGPGRAVLEIFAGRARFTGVWGCRGLSRGVPHGVCERVAPRRVQPGHRGYREFVDPAAVCLDRLFWTFCVTWGAASSSGRTGGPSGGPGRACPDVRVRFRRFCRRHGVKVSIENPARSWLWQYGVSLTKPTGVDSGPAQRCSARAGAGARPRASCRAASRISRTRPAAGVRFGRRLLRIVARQFSVVGSHALPGVRRPLTQPGPWRPRVSPRSGSTSLLRARVAFWLHRGRA